MEHGYKLNYRLAGDLCQSPPAAQLQQVCEAMAGSGCRLMHILKQEQSQAKSQACRCFLPFTDCCRVIGKPYARYVVDKYIGITHLLPCKTFGSDLRQYYHTCNVRISGRQNQNREEVPSSSRAVVENRNRNRNETKTETRQQQQQQQQPTSNKTSVVPGT